MWQSHFSPSLLSFVVRQPRDLKPRNLLVNSNCDLKICDFGLARVDEPEDHDRSVQALCAIAFSVAPVAGHSPLLVLSLVSVRTVMSNYIATRWYRAPGPTQTRTARGPREEMVGGRAICILSRSFPSLLFLVCVVFSEVILSRKRYTQAVDMWYVPTQQPRSQEDSSFESAVCASSPHFPSLSVSLVFCRRSVGCILAELIGRKPIFPGRDSFHQITLIVGILGTPPPASATATAGGSAPRKSTTGPSNGPTDDYISALPRKAKVPFHVLYPKSSPLACDLLDKLLCFEPEHRLTVEEALRHPYLADLHCEDDEPVCTHMDLTDFYFEYLKVTKDDLRTLIHQEIVNHYKEETIDLPPTVPASSSAATKAGSTAAASADPAGADQSLENFPGGMRKGLPGGGAGAGAAQPPPNANAASNAARKGRRKSF